MDLSLCLTNSQHIALPRPSTERSPRALFVKKQRFEQTWSQNKMPQSARQTNPRFRNTQMLFLNQTITDAPISAEEALKRWKFEMSRFEYTEILNYDEIYFVGLLANKTTNEEYDDLYHYYKINKMDQIAYRYEIRKSFMKDEHGTFVLAFDHKEKKEVVLQILTNTPEMRIWAESQIERQNLLDDPSSNNIMQHLSHFEFRDHYIFEYEAFGRTISAYAKTFHFWSSPNHPLAFPPIELDDLRKIAKPIIAGIRYLHSRGITHGNISSLSVFELNGKIRVVNYGYDPLRQILRYRAPEVILGLPVDGPASDMFSLGLLLIELVNGRPMFNGRTDYEQFAIYVDTFGMPPRPLMERSPRASELRIPKSGRIRIDRRDTNYRVQDQIHVPGGTHIRLSAADSRRVDETLFYELVGKCVNWWADRRITAEEAWRHPWLDAEDTRCWRKQAYALPSLSLKS
ncbi:CMGC family protein kinase [Tritrichomonas foetus]|uniref:dual-specificity kinase n=1 Tax=Tritrichomonas foetus TaxID=1144522 RepID=A0A1J4K9L7_9EUKA|nr:CMGC family protein kinase [Tritrichomonas foetus]|eukprot:OHT06396.1 CMGC family protein kinase [Tritrichomonas foetus]